MRRICCFGAFPPASCKSSPWFSACFCEVLTRQMSWNELEKTIPYGFLFQKAGRSFPSRQGKANLMLTSLKSFFFLGGRTFAGPMSCFLARREQSGSPLVLWIGSGFESRGHGVYHPKGQSTGIQAIPAANWELHGAGFGKRMSAVRGGDAAALVAKNQSALGA